MLTLYIQLFGGRGANYTLKKDTIAKNTNGKNIVIPKGTKVYNIKVIAGDDKTRRIDEIKGLVSKYGGKEKNWSKRVSTIKMNGQKADLHYYQNKRDNIGRVKYKIKRWI